MKCSQCGKELVTGDIHWEMGICNHCYNSVFSDVFINEKAIVYPSVVNISVDDFEEYKKALHRIAVLERALKNMQEVIVNSSDGCESCDYYKICNKAPLRDCFEIFIDQAEKELEEKE